MEKPLFQLSPGLKKVSEITFEGFEDVEALIKGLQFIVWEYLQENIDEGVDEKITGDFLSDFSDLLEYLLYVKEELQKT